jgi:hypothetical protein
VALASRSAAGDTLVDDSKSDYWFPIEHRLPWGWSHPVKWQGWLVYLLGFVFTFIGILKINNGAARGLYFVFLALLILGVHLVKGERRTKKPI